MDNQQVLVSIKCIAYNHEPYIRQCLDGLVMQQTNFRFEAIVHDDASTDKTADIIREYANKYPDIIKPIFETENQYSKHDGSIRRILDEACCGKYIAVCEGDDYWTDPLKLQKQVDFLESHLEYSLCFHPVFVLREDGTFTNEFISSDIPQTSDESDIIKNNYIATQSVLYRNIKELKGYIEDLGTIPFGDYVLWLLNTRYGLLYEIPEVMAVYRFGVGVWTNRSKFEQNIDSVYGYTKMLPLVLDSNNRQVFDQRILGMIEQLKLEYNNVVKDHNKVLQSKEYKLGIFLLKPIKKIKRFFKKKISCL